MPSTRKDQSVGVPLFDLFPGLHKIEVHIHLRNFLRCQCDHCCFQSGCTLNIHDRHFEFMDRSFQSFSSGLSRDRNLVEWIGEYFSFRVPGHHRRSRISQFKCLLLREWFLEKECVSILGVAAEDGLLYFRWFTPEHERWKAKMLVSFDKTGARLSRYFSTVPLCECRKIPGILENQTMGCSEEHTSELQSHVNL